MSACLCTSSWQRTATIDTHLSANDNGHNDLAPAVGIAGNVAGELVDIGYNDSLLTSGSGAADTLTKANLLAGGLAVERTEKQNLVLRGCVGCGDGYTTKVRAG